MITSTAKALRADFKIAMSGTPVENSLMDLWCITDFAYPGLLGTARSFSQKYQSPLKNEDVDIATLGEEMRHELGLFIKRRLKSDVAKDLPYKYQSNRETHHSHFESLALIREMPSEQHNKYKQAIYNVKEASGDSSKMLRFIQLIKEISDHPYLVEGTIMEHGIDELIKRSAKLQSTVEILDRIKMKQEKVIIFAERKETQQMIQRVVFERYGFMPHIINGDTPSIASKVTKARKSRQQTIQLFKQQDGFNVIILSPIAAGVGLNITAANHVIHYSRHWNPAKEEQATDRAYRIGQTKDVYVYYPMAVSNEFKSFDLILNELLNRKLTLANHTLFTTERAEVVASELFDNLIK